MSESKGDIKRTRASLVIMSRMDYEIARNVYELLPAAGISDEDLSFLLGKPNTYFFALLNPTEKKKFKTAQLDVLPTILNTPIRKIVPNKISPGEIVKLHNTSRTVHDDKIVYRHTVEYIDGSRSNVKPWTKKLVKGERRKKNPHLHEELINLVHSGYFSPPKTALQIYLRLVEKSDLLFPPADLQKSLAVLSRKDGPESVLKAEIMNGCYWYVAKH
ncbi:hypothetical protein [Arcticibacter sp.]|uniref:hypothetical protein n=1 Tax=Arcticibacter sp. TaxID=1872630 RepID=UPI00388D9F2E